MFCGDMLLQQPESHVMPPPASSSRVFCYCEAGAGTLHGNKFFRMPPHHKDTPPCRLLPLAPQQQEALLEAAVDGSWYSCPAAATHRHSTHSLRPLRGAEHFLVSGGRQNWKRWWELVATASQPDRHPCGQACSPTHLPADAVSA